MSADLPVGAYPTPQKAALFYDAVAPAVEGHSGRSAGWYFHALASSSGSAMARAFRLRGLRKRCGCDSSVWIRGICETFWNSCFRSGRGIGAQDRDGTPRVIVINEALASRLTEAVRRDREFGVSGPIQVFVRVMWEDEGSSAGGGDFPRDWQGSVYPLLARRIRPWCMSLWLRIPVRV